MLTQLQLCLRRFICLCILTMLIEFLQPKKKKKKKKKNITFTENVPVCTTNKRFFMNSCSSVCWVECVLDRLPQQRFSILNMEKQFNEIPSALLTRQMVRVDTVA